MLYHITALNSVAIASLGMALAETMRGDLVAIYGKFMTSIMNYAKEGSDLLIAENWMEQPPQAIRHENLATGK